MSLENIYLKQVKHTPINNFTSSMGNGIMPIIEKDPTIARLEQDVFSKLREISPPEEIQKPIGVQPLSVEDAIKELIELEKTNK
ncbi:MAG: hypothetical protein EBU90_01125 [Proteobacteria bacterium]|nr:hypothetical protein [Pseudomonadota bacterium]NBP13021.1 hypothetical protein [bacterium]